MNDITIGVVGVGHLGALHAKMLAGARNARLVSVFDTNGEKAAAVAAEQGCGCARSVEELLDAVDAVSIAVPTSLHFDIAAEAIRRGRHVFLEKPITRTVDEARALNALAREHGVMIQVGHIERFNPAIVALDRYNIAPVFVESHRLAQFNPRGTDVAVVLDLMIHDIDIILSLVGSEVVKIDANGTAVVSETADIANARLQFRNGAVANITASRISQNRMRKMRLFQKNAYISIDFLQGTSEVFRIVDADAADASEPTYMLGSIDQGAVKRTIVYEQPPVPQDHNPLRHELQLFVDAVRTGTKPVVDGLAGQHALEVAEQIMTLIS